MLRLCSVGAVLIWFSTCLADAWFFFFLSRRRGCLPSLGFELIYRDWPRFPGCCQTVCIVKRSHLRPQVRLFVRWFIPWWCTKAWVQVTVCTSFVLEASCVEACMPPVILAWLVVCCQENSSKISMAKDFVCMLFHCLLCNTVHLAGAPKRASSLPSKKKTLITRCWIYRWP